VTRNVDLRVEHPEPERAVVVLAGEHDLSSAHELRDLLAQLVGESKVLVVDLSEAQIP
jgi:anti-anti-sigma regulatory factor